VLLAIGKKAESRGYNYVKKKRDTMNNVTPSIQAKIGKSLHKIPAHPLCIVKEKVFEYFGDMARIDIDNPYVPIEYNFDRLRVPVDHPSRLPTDTYYKSDTECLRTHMTCYLYPLGNSSSGKSTLKYITCGDVYRKDAIDATHYPVFHQMDAFCIVEDGVNVREHLRERLSGLVKYLFGNEVDHLFLEDNQYEEVYFPFTVDSLEVSVSLPDENGKTRQLEILGAGTVHPDIMKELGLGHKKAWAFGLGIERLAMVMFGIPDIRLFWSDDKRFLNQFTPGKITKFVPYSKYEACYKDVSLFTSSKFSYNDLCSIARDVDEKNLIESISQIDEFQIKGRTSLCYRIMYRSMESTLKNTEINKIQKILCERLVSELEVQIR
jgi:phenylalanyl-tRNA synthetase alpha chain